MSTLQPLTQPFADPAPPFSGLPGTGGGPEEMYSPYCDENSPFFDPTLCSLFTSGTSVQSGGSGGGDVNVTVTNNIAVANNIGDQLAQAINSAMTTASNNASAIAQNTANQVSSTLSGTIGTLTNGITSAFGQLGTWFTQIVNYLGSHIQEIFGTIASTIGDAVGKIASAVANAIGPITTAVSGALQDIHDFMANVIAPIFNAVNQAIQTISALTTAIERDLHNGLQGILNIPNDIATGLGSLDASIDRVWQQINEGNRLNTDVTLRDVIQKELGQQIVGLGANITKTGGVSNLASTFHDKVNLAEPSLTDVAQQFITAWGRITGASAKATTELGDSVINSILQNKVDASWVTQSLLDAGLTIFFTVITLLGETVPLAEFLEAYTKRQLPLTKLDPSTVIAAWRRGFIEDANASDELGYEGFDASRIKILKDLANSLISVSDIVDMFMKGIVSEQDARANMAEQGFDDVDQTALLANAFRAFDIGTAIRGWRYGNLTDDQLQAVMRENRIGANETQAYFAAALDQESVSGVITRHRFGALLGIGLLTDPTFSNLPQDIIDAAKREGIDANSAGDLWASSFTVPGIEHWLNLFYRGIRTDQELKAVMDYWKVPKEWQNDYIDGQRPLIPFRTIPAMLKSGIITETRAAQLLAQHGFDLPSIQNLLDYAKRNTTANTAATAAKVHTESVGVATELYNFGAITDAQYSAVLAAHGYDQTAIAAQIQLESLKSQVAHRKQVAEDIVGSALEGNISTETAQQQLAQQGFSPGEQVKYLKQIKAAKATTSKLPSTAELVSMVKSGVIDDDTFKSTLQKSGYSADWAQKLWAIHFAVFPSVNVQPAS